MMQLEVNQRLTDKCHYALFSYFLIASLVIKIKSLLEDAIMRIRSQKSPFCIVSNATAQADYLSWGAIGLLTYCMSMPQDWEFKTKNIWDSMKGGRDQLYRIFQELIDQGHCLRIYQPNPKAPSLKGTARYEIFDSPEDCKNRAIELSEVEKFMDCKEEFKKCFRHPGNRDTGNREAGIQEVDFQGAYIHTDKETEEKETKNKNATQRVREADASFDPSPEQLRCAALLKLGDLGQEEQRHKPVASKESKPTALNAPKIDQNSSPAVLTQKNQDKASYAHSSDSSKPRDIRGRPVDIDAMENDIYMRLGSTYDAGTIKAAIHRVKNTKSPIGDVFRLTETICQAILAETETPKKKKRASDELPPNVVDTRGMPTITWAEYERLEKEGKLEEYKLNLKKQGYL